MDRPKAAAHLQSLKESTLLPVVPLSAQYGRGVKEVMAELRAIVERQGGHKRRPRDNSSVDSFASHIARPRNPANKTDEPREPK
jgi:Fe2+ transport system protein B